MNKEKFYVHAVITIYQFFLVPQLFYNNGTTLKRLRFPSVRSVWLDVYCGGQRVDF